MSVHFNSEGKQNTGRTLELAVARAAELGIREMVVATTSGETAVLAARVFDGKVVAVTHAAGFREAFKSEVLPEHAEELRKLGVTVVTATHALSAGERAVSKEKGGTYPLEIVADSLRMFGQGSKVCVECVLMAADAGALSGTPVIAVAGTGRGADTALVIAPAHSRNMFDLAVDEVVCKPRLSGK